MISQRILRLPAGETRDFVKKILIIIVTALILRSAFFCVWIADGRGQHISSDSQDYYSLAQSLNRGEGFQIEGQWVSRRPPVYAVFLAGIMRFLPFPGGVQAIQIFFGALSCLLAYGLGRRLFGEIPGFIAGVLLACNYEFIRQVMTVMPEVLYVFFILGSLWLTFRAKDTQCLKMAAAAGAAAGLSLLTKDALIFFYPFVALWLLGGSARFKSRVILMLCYCLGLGGMLLPWRTINANHQVMSKAVVSDRLGMTFYIANNPKATGGTGGQEWELGRDSFLPSDEVMAGIPEAESDRYYFAQGLAFIREQPRQFVKLMGRKIVNMWRPYTSDAPRTAKIVMTATYVPLVMLGIMGMVLSLKRWKSLLPLYILIGYIFSLHAVLIAHIRYRFAAIPIFALFAGYALFFISDKIRLSLRAAK